MSLELRGLSPREPVAYALAQPGPSNAELSTGDLRVRGAITVLLGVSWVEHDGLLICAVNADGAVASAVLIIRCQSPAPHSVVRRCASGRVVRAAALMS